MQKVVHRNALNEWEAVKAIDWELAVCLHMPKAMQVNLGGQSRAALQRLLSRYFNAMDRRLFKNAHKRRGVRTNRFVVLEYSPKVGWHAHVLVSSPRRFSPSRYKAFLRQYWLRFTAKQTKLAFRPHLFWAEANSGDGYLQYCLKHVCEDADECANHLPTKPIGIIDLHNTHLG